MNWTEPDIFIHATDQVSVDKAQQLAAKIGVPIAKELPSGWRLLVSKNRLKLARPDGVSVQVNFIDGKATRRASEANFKRQPLARALGLNKIRAINANAKDSIPTIIDATAGFGTDAWLMASLGCSVILLEQSPILHSLLEDGLAAAQRAQQAQRADTTAEQLELVNTNAIDYLRSDSSVNADIVYLDPMYPAARKQALVKKGMQLLHELIGPDDNGSALLQAALHKANYRVVVKRPKGAPLLAGSDSWSGQTTSVVSPNTRYDIYHIVRDD